MTNTDNPISGTPWGIDNDYRFCARAGHFEVGDFVIVEPGRVLICYCGKQSQTAGSEQVAAFFRDEGWESVTALISRELVHMDGFVVLLTEKLLVACRDALDPWVVQ